MIGLFRFSLLLASILSLIYLDYPLPNSSLATYPDVDCFKSYRDSLRALELKSLSEESYSYTQYLETESAYHLVYHRKGLANNSQQELGISAISVSDTTIRLFLLQVDRESWLRIDSLDLFIDGFSPAMFHAVYSDYNQDGIEDLRFVFSQSMSVAYSYGPVVLIGAQNKPLTLLANSDQIPNLQVKDGKIISITYNHPGHESRSYKRRISYAIIAERLQALDTSLTYLD